MQNRICLLIVWFGDLPSWMSFFLTSCGKSRGIDWKIFSEQSEVPKAPENVHFHYLSRKDFEQIVAARLGVEYSFAYGYKLCDMKPAYGDFFSEYLQGYDYSGYSDIDVIMGDPQRALLAADAFSSDVITASSRLLLGHFTLFRNTSRFRLLYRECTNWHSKFQTEDYEIFDELDFSDYVRSLRSVGALTIAEVLMVEEDCCIEWSGRPCFFVMWKDGQLWDLLVLRRPGYFHFIRTKKRRELVPAGVTPGRVFVLTNLGFLSLHIAGDKLRCLCLLLLGVFRTVPWYLKQLLKLVVPKAARLRLRTAVLGEVSVQE